MEGKHEYISTPNQTAEAEQRLTPEQAIGSKARYEIMKNQDVLRAVGLSEDKVQEAATLASEKAVEMFHELEQSGPWKNTMDVIEKVKPKLSQAEQLLLNGHQRWAQEFVVKWREELERAKMETGKDVDANELVHRVWNTYNGHAPVGGFHAVPPDRNEPHWAVLPHQFPSIDLMRSKYRGVVDDTIADRKDSRFGELLLPTEEGIKKVFKEFGASFPEKIKNSYERDPETLVPTQFSGVYLDVLKIGDSKDYALSLVFSPEVLQQMIQAHEELNKNEME